MGSKQVDYDELLKHQNFLRVVNRRLLEEICPSDFQENLNTLLTKNNKIVDVAPQKIEKHVVNMNKNTQTDLQIEEFEDDGDDGYKSGPVDTSEDVESKKQNGNRIYSNEDKLLSDNKPKDTNTNAQRRRPASASRIQNQSRTRSLYHQKCKPHEPDRRFIALPLPSNLYQSDRLKIGSKYVNLINYLI